jgi:hypothetical protein
MIADAGPGNAGGPSACTSAQKEGAACTAAGADRDPGLGCHVYLICAASDPKRSPGGCPISLARYKKDIGYLGNEELQSVHDELMTMSLATWRYVGEDAASVAVGGPAYGYTGPTNVLVYWDTIYSSFMFAFQR